MKKRHERYLEIIKQMNQKTGELKEGETRVITDPADLAELEKNLQKDFSDKGQPAEFGKVGVIFENPWYVFMNEPVRFPAPDNESVSGSYLRVLYKGDIEGEKSIFCLPVLESGEILLTVSYRTTVRDWVVEAPGTATKSGETHEDALRRCIKEKLGHKLISTKTLSSTGIISERGIMGAAVPVYLAMVGQEQLTKPVDRNVREVVKVKLSDLKKGFLEGSMKINGRECLCQDGYTSFALFMMMLKD